MVMGGHDQVPQFVGFAAGELPRTNQLQPVKRRPVATAALLPLADCRNTFVQQSDYARITDHAAEERPGTAALRFQVSVQPSEHTDASIVVASFLGRLRRCRT